MKSWVINLLKFMCAQLIVMHHICGYGPMRDTLGLSAPDALEFFIDCTRLIVQVFLVMGGFLAAQTLMSGIGATWGSIIAKRFIRLAPFYWLTLLAVIGVGYWVAYHVSGEWLPEGFQWRQFLAHAFLLQGVLGQESISAGVWYVAIDFQLFALLGLCVTLCKGSKSSEQSMSQALCWCVWALTVSSFWFFNRFEDLDNWCIYFMGAYGVGVLAAWGAQQKADRWFFWSVWGLGWTSMIYYPRIRIVLALCVSLLLFVSASNSGSFLSEKIKSRLELLGASAYATFLNHFIWIMVFSALWNILHLSGWPMALFAMVLCWMTSCAWGIWAHVNLERPLLEWAKTWRVSGLRPFRVSTQVAAKPLNVQ